MSYSNCGEYCSILHCVQTLSRRIQLLSFLTRSYASVKDFSAVAVDCSFNISAMKNRRFLSISLGSYFREINPTSQDRFLICGYICLCKHYSLDKLYQQGLMKYFPTSNYFWTLFIQSTKLNISTNTCITVASLV